MFAKEFLFGILVLPIFAYAENPPCQTGMIVCTGALNYDAKILAFDAAKGLYKVQYVTGYKGDIEWVSPKA
jgi:hypothetical protein